MRFARGTVVSLLATATTSPISSLAFSSSTSLHHRHHHHHPSTARHSAVSIVKPSTSSSLLSLRSWPSTVFHGSSSGTRSSVLRHDSSSSSSTSLCNTVDDNSSSSSSPSSGGGTASIPNEIFNLVKSIVGAGVLSLPAGIAAYGNAPSAIYPAILFISLIGMASAYGFSLIGRVCAMTGGRTYRDAWSKSVGEDSSWIPAVTCTFKTCFAVLSYSMILADTIQSLVRSSAAAAAAAPSSLLLPGTTWSKTTLASVTRTQALLGITTTTLLPLCLVKNLSGLAPFSLVGVVGMIYTAIAMVVRYVGKSYALPIVVAAATKSKGGATAAAMAGNGKYLSDISSTFRPKFGTLGARGAHSPHVFILICLLSTAYSKLKNMIYICHAHFKYFFPNHPQPARFGRLCVSLFTSYVKVAHFNAPKFYIELKDNTIKRYNTVVASSFAISIALFAIIGTSGFLTFGSASSGLILNNYSGSDTLMRLSRIAVAISLIFSFPLAFAGARDGWLDLLNVPVSKRSNTLLTQTTLAILGGVTFAASQLKELAFIMSFAGATMGNALIYVYPALMFRSAVKGMGHKASAGLKREVPFALLCAAFGIGMGGMGAKMALSLL